MKKTSIVIPTRNRKPVLFKTLGKLQNIIDHDSEILVYDDASDEDYSQEIKAQFPAVRFFRNNTWVGMCEARNRLIKEAAGEFIICQDDDSYFLTKEDYVQAKLWSSGPLDFGIIGFKVLVSNGVQFPPCECEGIYAYNAFMGCGFMAKRTLLMEVGGFDPFVNRQGDEKDLVIRVLAKGQTVLFTSEVKVFHEQSPMARDHQFIHSYAFRNELYFYLKFFPFLLCFIFIMKCLLSHAIFCARKFWFKAYFLGMAKFLKDFPRLIAKRDPVTWTVVAKFLRLRHPKKVMENSWR